MGARRNKTADDQAGTDVAILDADYSEHDTAIEDDQDAVEREILNEAGASENQVQYEIRVFRIPESGNTYPSLFTIPGENVAGIRDRLAQEYGTGHYELRVYKNRTLHRRLRLKIELPRSQPQPPANNAGDAVAQAVLQQGKLLEAVLAKIMSAPPPPPPPQQNMVEMFTGMAAMAKAMRDISGPAPVVANPLEMLGAVITLVKDASSEGREKGIMDLVGDFLNSDLAKSVANQLTNPQHVQQPQQPPRAIAPPPPGSPAQPHQPSAPAPAPAPTPASAPMPSADVTATPTDPNEAAFHLLLDILVSAAAKNSDPILYADFIADRVAPEMIEQLLALPDPVAALAAYKPAIATYRPWMQDVIEALTAEPEDETTGGAPNPPATVLNAADERAPASSADGSPGRG